MNLRLAFALAAALATLGFFCAQSVPRAQATSAADAVTLYLSPETETVTQGAQFTVEVHVTIPADPRPANVVQAELSYPAAQLSYVDSSLDTADWTIMLGHGGGNGLVHLDEGTVNKLTGDQLVGTITFEAVGAGDAHVDFTSNSVVYEFGDDVLSETTGGIYTVPGSIGGGGGGGGSSGGGTVSTQTTTTTTTTTTSGGGTRTQRTTTTPAPRAKPVKLGKSVTLAPRTRHTACKRGSLPDRRCSPGAYYSGLTKAVLCSSSFRTGTVRNVSEAEKHQVEIEYGMPAKSYRRMIEIDHIVSLEIGGSNDIANLFPEPGSGPANYHVKDKLENRLHTLVCNGTMTLHTAQTGIAHNWETLYKQVFGVAPTS